MKKTFYTISAFILVLFPAISHAATLSNPLGTTDIKVIISRIVQALLGITGAVALLMFVWGGFQWMASAGNPEWIKKGKETMKWAIFGLVIMISAYMIISTIVTALETGSIT